MFSLLVKRALSIAEKVAEGTAKRNRYNASGNHRNGETGKYRRKCRLDHWIDLGHRGPSYTFPLRPHVAHGQPAMRNQCRKLNRNAY